MEAGTKPLDAPARPRAGITATAGLMALCCLGFAVSNIVFELTDRFADGPYAEYSAGFTVMNWLVVVLKVVGAAVALLSVAGRPRILPPVVVGVLLWGAFAMLALYAMGSVVLAIGVVSGAAGGAGRIDAAGVAYVLFFLFIAAGYGVLAISYSRRHRLPGGVVVLGVLGAPLGLALILLAAPMLLVALGVMPAY